MKRPEILAVIPARAGSRRLPKKNLKELRGKPLIAWTIEAALHARSVTRTVVTTEDQALADCAKKFGAEVPVMRPASLALDDSPGMLPILHILEWLRDHERYQPDIVVVLQPTSPLRTAEDVDTAIGLMRDDATCVASVTRVAPASWLRSISPSRELEHPVQGDDEIYVLNGAIYAARTRMIHATREMDDGTAIAYVMPRERSVDIDDIADFELASWLMERSSR